MPKPKITDMATKKQTLPTFEVAVKLRGEAFVEVKAASQAEAERLVASMTWFVNGVEDNGVSLKDAMVNQFAHALEVVNDTPDVPEPYAPVIPVGPSFQGVALV